MSFRKPKHDVFPRLFYSPSFLFLSALVIKSRTDKAVDEQVKKFLLDSCKVDADKVRSFDRSLVLPSPGQVTWLNTVVNYQDRVLTCSVCLRLSKAEEPECTSHEIWGVIHDQATSVLLRCKKSFLVSRTQQQYHNGGCSIARLSFYHPDEMRTQKKVDIRRILAPNYSRPPPPVGHVFVFCCPLRSLTRPLPAFL